MGLWSQQPKKRSSVANRAGQTDRAGRARFVRHFFRGLYPPGTVLQQWEVGAKYVLDEESVAKAFAEFVSLGMLKSSGGHSAVVIATYPKEMREAYEVRAGLEEIAGRSAAAVLKGNTDDLQRELDSMREAVSAGSLDAFAEHDIKFHKTVLKASQNGVIVRVWDSLAIDLRMRAALSVFSNDLAEVVESHQPIVDALQKGRGREASLLLRNHVETILEYLKRSESDSGMQRAIRSDLEDAKEVQQAFFPPKTVSIPCISCETFYQPARGIGGDYYDFLSLQDGRWGIAIGDVSGKGIGAALVMASLQAALKSQALKPHLDLSTLLGDVNRLVHESSPMHIFATLFYAEYEPATRKLRYVNAGHNSPFVLRPRSESCEIFRLESEGVPLGISAESQFSSTEFQFEPDDLFVAYTDGISEASNAQAELWGEKKLENLLKSCNRMNPQEIIDAVLGEVSVFAHGQPQRDDVTLVVMRVQDGCVV